MLFSFPYQNPDHRKLPSSTAQGLRKRLRNTQGIRYGRSSPRTCLPN